MDIKVVKTNNALILEKVLKQLNTKVAKVGWLENLKHVQKNSKNKQSANPPFIAEVAAQNEFGNPSKNIPARPFMRPTIANKQNEWKSLVYIQSKKMLKGEIQLTDLLENLGLTAAGQIKKTIQNIWTPSLKQRTILQRIDRYTNDLDLSHATRKRRKSKIRNFIPPALYKPLIDTGLMISTLTNSVEDSA